MTTMGRMGSEDPAGVRGDGRLVRACVRVGELETWYERWGRGPLSRLVLVREVPPWMPDAWLETMGRAGRCLLIPQIPVRVDLNGDAEARERFGEWLLGFLDGLGLERVEVLCEPALEPLVRRVRADEPDRFVGPLARVVPPYRGI